MPVNTGENAERISSSKDRSRQVNTVKPINMSLPIFLYRRDGSNYTGKFIVEQVYLKEEVKKSVFYEYINNKKGEQLYYRNDLLQKKNVVYTEQEQLFKKMYKVINKIINLPIFTDN